MPPNVVLRLRMTREDQKTFVTVDGQQRIKITGDDEVRISRSEHPLRLIQMAGFNYYQL